MLGDELRTLKKRQASEAATKTKPSTAAKKPAQPPPSEFSFDLDVDEAPGAPVDGHVAHARQKASNDELEVLDLGSEKPLTHTTSKPHVPEPSRPADSTHRIATPTPVQPAAKSGLAAQTTNPLGDLVLDLEEALGSDFGKPLQAAAAAAHAPAPVVMTPQQTGVLAAPQRPVRDDETTSVLSDLFEEFKGEVEVEADAAEDPETHYNLGVAFKEMGLLDEAIGELQKVCHAINNGKEFSQVLQAYTWLAHCLMEKGAPQAAVRWYESALKVRGIAEESRLAVYYDLASAHEASGDRKAALDDLMKVYGSNIDYRDVAERIKTLRS